MNRQQHPEPARRQARQAYEQHGSRRAAETTGISRRTINAWAKAEGWQRKLATVQRAQQRFQPVAPVSGAQPASAKGVPSIGYSQRRRRLLERFGEELAAALDQIRACRERGKARDAREWAVVAGILLDKCEVLVKAAGGGLDAGVDPETARARLWELVGVLDGRAAGDA